MVSQRHKYGVSCSPDKILETAKTLHQHRYQPFDLTTGVLPDVRDSDTWRHGDILWIQRDGIDRTSRIISNTNTLTTPQKTLHVQ